MPVLAGVTLATATRAGASPPLPCAESGDQLPPGLIHGEPWNGLAPAPAVQDYNYLFVSPTAKCPVAPSYVHLFALFRVNQIVPAIGQPGRTPGPNDAETFWFTFHSGTSSAGFSITATSNAGGTWRNHNVPGKGTAFCVTLHGTEWAAINYVGPDVFKGSYGAKVTVVGPNIVTLKEELVIVP